MVVTFPHMGKIYIAVKALFDDLDVKTVVPPLVTKATLEIGTALSPEMACLPLKINIGNYIQSIKKGADTVVLTGSCGPCRFGYYGVVQKEILKDMGYDVEFIILDTPLVDGKAFFNKIQKITNNQPWSKIAKAFISASRIAERVDELLEISLKKRPRELSCGDTDRLMQGFERDIANVYGSREIDALIREYHQRLRDIPEKAHVRPVKIGLVGEIYTLIEPYVNLNIERKLGSLGVEVFRGITSNDWIKIHLSMDLKFKREHKRIMKKASPYLNYCVGGHARETIASTINYHDIGLDGVVQILPFGCMPEIVAESILPKVAGDLSFPIMSLTVDELTGEAGYMTRLEAFVDLLSSKKGNVV